MVVLVHERDRKRLKRGGAKGAEESRSVDLCELCASAFPSLQGIDGNDKKATGTPRIFCDATKKGPMCYAFEVGYASDPLQCLFWFPIVPGFRR